MMLSAASSAQIRCWYRTEQSIHNMQGVSAANMNIALPALPTLWNWSERPNCHCRENQELCHFNTLKYITVRASLEEKKKRNTISYKDWNIHVLPIRSTLFFYYPTFARHSSSQLPVSTALSFRAEKFQLLWSSKSWGGK